MEPPLEQKAEKGDGRLKPVELDLTETEIREGLADLAEFNRDYDRLHGRGANGRQPSRSTPATPPPPERPERT